MLVSEIKLQTEVKPLKHFDLQTIPDELYQSLIPMVMKSNRKLSETLHRPLKNYDWLYNYTRLPFDEQRFINMRHIKIPTFVYENKPSYYCCFFVDIEDYRLGEIQKISSQCAETIDDRNSIDSYTIFLFGCLHGHINPLTRKQMKENKTYVVNRIIPNDADRTRVLRFMCTFLSKKINRMDSGGKIFGQIDADCDRLRGFVEGIENVV